MNSYHKAYAGKVFKLRAGSWSDESRTARATRISPETTMKAIGYLAQNDRVFLWWIHWWEKTVSSDPLLDWEFLDKHNIIVCLFTGIRTNWPERLFSCTAYPEMHLEEIASPTPPRKVISEFPHKCPKCQNPAYIGFTNMRCSIPGCHPERR